MQREDVERLAARLRETSWGNNVTDSLERWVLEREEAADLIVALLAERDAAFAAGLEAAAEAVLYLCRMKGMGNRTIDGPEAAHLIRDLPIKPRS